MSEPMDLIYKDPKYPSSKVVNGLSMAGPRAHLRGMGLVNEELAKPFIGVINTYNEMHLGHIHLNRIGQLVKDGVREAGGVPFEVNTISLCDGFSQGHVGMCSVLPSREVIADSIEVYAGGHQLDGLVLIGGCDKIGAGHDYGGTAHQPPHRARHRRPHDAGRIQGEAVRHL